ncbi:MAG: type II toxin-antitoxin system RelE/ParE family toxin [Candidatus Entotheonellia bacterium]
MRWIGKGFGDAGVLEIVEDYSRETSRAVYTVRLAEVISVWYAFQKKSKRGVNTPTREIDLIKARLNRAEEVDKQWRKTQEA